MRKLIILALAVVSLFILAGCEEIAQQLGVSVTKGGEGAVTIGWMNLLLG